MMQKALLELLGPCRGCSFTRQAVRNFSTSRNTLANYYELLQVQRDASPAEIKAAFFKMSKKYHPDSNPNNPELHKQFVQLNEAYSILSKSLARKHYDQSLRMGTKFQTTNVPPRPRPDYPFGPGGSHGHGPFEQGRSQSQNYYYYDFKTAREGGGKRYSGSTSHAKMMAVCLSVLGGGYLLTIFVYIFVVKGFVYSQVLEQDRQARLAYAMAKENARKYTMEEKLAKLRKAYEEKQLAKKSGRVV